MGDIPVGIKYGDLGDADPGICGSTGQSIYNVEHCISVDAHKFKELGVITENGIKMTTKSFMNLKRYLRRKQMRCWKREILLMLLKHHTKSSLKIKNVSDGTANHLAEGSCHQPSC